MHDIVDTIGISQVLTPQTIQASALNTGDIDTQGAEALAVVVLAGLLVGAAIGLNHRR